MFVEVSPGALIGRLCMIRDASREYGGGPRVAETAWAKDDKVWHQKIAQSCRVVFRAVRMPHFPVTRPQGTAPEPKLELPGLVPLIKPSSA